jgi:beta-mannanase
VTVRRSFLGANLLFVLVFLAAGSTLTFATTLRGEQGLRAILDKEFDASRTQMPTIEIGIYDPDEQFSRSDGLAINEFFLDWNEYSQPVLQYQLTDSQARGRLPLLVIEPTARATGEPNVLRDMSVGLYDDITYEICTDLAEFGQRALVAWGPWMDDSLDNLQGNLSNAEEYKFAYRRFVGLCRSIAPRVAFIWSPKGNDNLLDYWPGSSFVDFVGISLLVDPVRDRTERGQLRSFDELFIPRYRLIERLHKEVLVTQLGVPGTSEEQSSWLDSAKLSASSFPLLKAFVYFNSLGETSRSHVVESGLSVDWRVSNWTLLPNAQHK